MFPGANGIFHLLAPHQKVCNIEIIASIFEQARNKWTIPIFRNSKGDTPMDACLDPEIETKNLNLAGLLFEKTMDYPTLHSSHTMNRAICTALSNRIPQVIPYISARMVKSKQLSVERMMNNALKKEKAQKVNNFVYAAEEFPIWANKAKIAESIFEKEGIPNKLDLCFFDISYITD
jgi:hypothetical protein